MKIADWLIPYWLQQTSYLLPQALLFSRFTVLHPDLHWYLRDAPVADAMRTPIVKNRPDSIRIE